MGKPRKRTSGNRRRALPDHKQDGKILQPPFLAGLAAASRKGIGEAPRLQGHTWHDDILPDLFWIALLYRRLPQRTGEICTTLIRTAASLVETSPPLLFGFASQYSQFPSALIPRLQSALAEAKVLDELLTALSTQRVVFPGCPMNALFQGKGASYAIAEEDAAREAVEAARLVAVRRTADAAVIQGMALLGMALVRPGILPYRLGFEHLHLYPTTAESRRAEQQTRMSIGGLSAAIREDASWREYFWRQGFAVTPCWPADRRFHEGSMDSRSVAESLLDVLEKLDVAVVEALEAAWDKSPIDLARPLESEVYGALLTRQVRFLRHLLTKPDYWNNELGGLVLRSMAESAITLGWLVRKGTADSLQQYWLYGLGQEKLALDHLAASPLKGEFLNRRRERDIAARREWLESQRTNQLLPVDLSNWTKLKVRELAEQAEMIDTYSAVYGPMSASVHGSWNAIGRTCMRYCMNPLHRFHLVPDVQGVTIDLTVPLTGVRVLQAGWEAYRVWATEVGDLEGCERALVEVARALESLREETSAIESQSEEDPEPRQ